MSYRCDAASRRTQMPVAGQSSVNYSYDNANRRTTLTLPNGITLSYGYDIANQLMCEASRRFSEIGFVADFKKFIRGNPIAP
ncbi:MAG: RHS repeat domain-containing protein [Gammaproteobacteria bacterium]